MSTSESTQRHKGRVKFFNSVKGFGFILPEATIQDEENINKIEGKISHNNKNIEVFLFFHLDRSLCPSYSYT